MGTAVGGTIADFTEFDRKNYFYPDIPKGYQISQYKYPLVSGGSLAGVLLTRIHLEEDTAKSTHDTGTESLVDFNRAGVPLMELVTEPVIHSAEEASKFAKELQLLLQYLGAGDANMEKGEMRVEAYISVAVDDGSGLSSTGHSKKLGTKVEVKNLNSFRSVERAIAFEIDRHISALENGEKIVQETRGWDEVKEVTFSQRLKEESHDYRYFPDPDLPKLYLSEIPEFSANKISKELGDLPWTRREKLKADFGLRDEDAEMFVRTKAWGDFFTALINELESMPNISKEQHTKLVASAVNYMNSDLASLIKSNVNLWQKELITPTSFVKMIVMLNENKISSRGAKDILKIMFEEGGNPSEIADKKGLVQKSGEGDLLPVVKKIIEGNTALVAEIKAGKVAGLQFLLGQAMKETRGAGNPEVLKALFLKEIGF
jgi:aspartyl-tRNA(Asn)/glutamyl-tRNA(Gln) amidotransferase subunit B